MPCISKFYGISIYFYAGDHLPPHFHAFYGDEEAMILIATGRSYRGQLSARASRMVNEWSALHRAELEANFSESQKPMPKFKQIPPLP